MANVKTIRHGDFTWYNIETVDSGSLYFLKDNFKFHSLDYKDLSSGNEQSKVDIYKNYLFVVLHFPDLNVGQARVVDKELDIFIGPKFLITVQKVRFKNVKDLYFKLLNNKNLRNEYFNKGPGYLLYKLLEKLFQDSLPLLNQVGRDIKEIEEDVYSETKNVVKDLAVIRRNILTFRRIIDPQRYVIGSLARIRRSYLPEELEIYFDDIEDYIKKIWSILENYKEIVAGLNVTNEALISHRTNEVIKVLTIFSVALLPLTLLSGIYGMNINLPFARHPAVVWFIFLSLILVVLAVLAYFRRKKWL